MQTSKFSLIPISILIGLLVLTSFLSVPVQAKSGAGDVQQSGNPAGKPPTKTRRPKSTSVAKTTIPKTTSAPKTATPQPGITAAISMTVGITSSVVSTIGTGTSVVNTVTPQPTFTFSSDMNTVVAQLTATSGAVYATSTSLALTASSTPTSVGAPTSTPNNLEQTATSIVLTTVPTNSSWQPTVTLPAVTFSVDEQIPVTSGQPTKPQLSGMMFGILGIGLLLLLVMVYLLGKELRKSSTKSK